MGLILFWEEIKQESLPLSKVYLLLCDVSVKELKVIGRNSFPLIYFSLNTEKNSFVLSDKVENFRFLKISATIIPVLLKQKPFMNTVIV